MRFPGRADSGDSNHQLRHHRAASLQFKEPEDWSMMFSLCQEQFATHLLHCLSTCSQCPSVWVSLSAGPPQSCRPPGMLQLSCWWCPKGLCSQPPTCNPEEHWLTTLTSGFDHFWPFPEEFKAVAPSSQWVASTLSRVNWSLLRHITQGTRKNPPFPAATWKPEGRAN